MYISCHLLLHSYVTVPIYIYFLHPLPLNWCSECSGELFGELHFLVLRCIAVYISHYYIALMYPSSTSLLPLRYCNHCFLLDSAVLTVIYCTLTRFPFMYFISHSFIALYCTISYTCIDESISYSNIVLHEIQKQKQKPEHCRFVLLTQLIHTHFDGIIYHA